MSLPTFSFTSRAVPVVELGVGDTRVDVGTAVWDTAHWDDPDDATWSGAEPTWLDVTCNVQSVELVAGRQRVTDLFAPATVLVTMDNASGWIGGTFLTLRPGRSLRVSIDHTTLGRRVLFRGYVDSVVPRYRPDEIDIVEIEAICALGEVARTATVKESAPVGADETADLRVKRILDKIKWPTTKRSLEATSTAMLPTVLGEQAADLLARTADSSGGSLYGDTAGRLVFRGRDWQVYLPSEPVDATIGNGAASDVCPSAWDVSARRIDIITQVILGRETDPAGTVYDDPTGQTLYGIETYEATDLQCRDTSTVTLLAARLFRTRGASSLGGDVPMRIERVYLDAATADAALDLCTTVDVFEPSRYRCRLIESAGPVFDRQMFAVGVRHYLDPNTWTVDIDLDPAAPFAAWGARWSPADPGTDGVWDKSTWAVPTQTLEEAA